MNKIQDLNRKLYDCICNDVTHDYLIKITNDVIHTSTLCVGINNHSYDGNNYSCEAMASDITFEVMKHIYSDIRNKVVKSNAIARHADILNYANNIKDKIIVASPIIYTVLSMYSYSASDMVRDNFSSIDYIGVIDKKISIRFGIPSLTILSDSISAAVPIEINDYECTTIGYSSISL